MPAPDQDHLNILGQDLGMQYAMAILNAPPSLEDAALFYNEEATVHFIAGAAFYFATHVANEKYQMRAEGPLEGHALEAFHSAEVKAFMERVSGILLRARITTALTDNWKEPKS